MTIGRGACAAIVGGLLPCFGADPSPVNAPVAPKATLAAMPPEPPLEWIMAGRHVYDRQCLVCHGKWGDGRGELSVGMVPKPRRLTSGVFKYRSTPSGLLPTDVDLERTLRTGVAGTPMSSFAETTTEEDRWDLVAFIRGRKEDFQKGAGPWPGACRTRTGEWAARPFRSMEGCRASTARCLNS